MAKPKLALVPSAQGSKFYSVLPSSGVGDFNFTRSGSATRINSQGLIETVGNGVSRLNYPLLDGKVVGCPHHILEPQRTNSITHSNDFSQSIYGKINLTITANQGISPDGTQNANLLVPNASVGNRYLSNNTGSNLKTNTVFLKKKELRYVNVGNASSTVVVDLENGTLSASSVSINNFTIENYGNGWYRVSCYNSSSTNFQIQVFFGVDGSGSNIATNGTDGVYIYGFEIQNGSYPTSYIPTNGSTVTRSAETANGSGDADTFNDSEGVLMFEVSTLTSGGGNRIISLSDGQGANKLEFNFDPPLNRFTLVFTANTSNQYIVQLSLNEINFNKIAIKYKTNDFALWINGIELDSQLSGNTLLSSSFDRINLANQSNGFPFYANTKQLQYYNSALTDSELETLTSWNSFTDMANSQQYSLY